MANGKICTAQIAKTVLVSGKERTVTIFLTMFMNNVLTIGGTGVPRTFLDSSQFYPLGRLLPKGLYLTHTSHRAVEGIRSQGSGQHTRICVTHGEHSAANLCRAKKNHPHPR